MIRLTSKIVDRGRHAGKVARELWQRSARTIDTPVSTTDWRRLMVPPQPLGGPMHWGLSLGPYKEPHGSGARLTPLGRLVAACRQTGDPAAACVLAALLCRWLSHLDAGAHFDYLVAYPRGFASGPPRGVALILGAPQIELPLRILAGCWEVRSAQMWHPDTLHAGFADTDAHVAVSPAVRGRRLLLIEDLHQGSEYSSPWIELLLGGGAARVGVLAICSAAETPV